MDIDKNLQDERFPSLEEFKLNTGEESTAGERVKAIPFRELPLNQVFAIADIKNFKFKTREAVILKLRDSQGCTLDVWGTSVIIKDISEKKDRYQGKKLFIISKGRRETGNRYYYDFSILPQ